MLSTRQNTISRKPVNSGTPSNCAPPNVPAPETSPDGQIQSPARRHDGIHWRASMTMLASLFIGIFIALGHHLFYDSLNRKPVGAPEHVIRGVTRQQLNLTLGTLFAFLVKAFLVVAVSIAYTQIVWRAVKKRATTLTTIDTIFHAVSNFWSLMNFSVWWKYPLLFLLSLTIWLVPIASVITPAALTVAVAATDPVPWDMRRVPNVDFLSLNFANIESVRGPFRYNGPRYAVDKVVAATAAQGSILPITAPAQNSSWILDFAGPSLNCTNIQGSFVDDVKKNIQAAVAIEQCKVAFGYIGWTPKYLHVSNLSAENYTLYSLPFVLSQNNTSYALQNAPLGPLPTLENGPDLPATFYAAVFASMADTAMYDFETCNENPNGNPQPNITLFQCELYNASYHVSFSFVNNKQNINITLDATPYNAVIPVSTLNTTSAYSPVANYYSNSTVSSYDTTEVQTLSYQSVMDSLNQILVGTLFNSEALSGSITANNTSVMSTVLAETEEMAWLNDYSQGGNPAELQQYIQTAAYGPDFMWNGVDVLDNFTSAIPFKEALQSLFQNITIGLMSNRLLQPNLSSPYAPPLTNVSLPHYETVYIYSPYRLLLAYGLAILFSTLGVLIGLLAMLSNGVAYTNNFSTILRTARHVHMDTAILPEDADGKDPLPGYLGKASVEFEDGVGGRGDRESWKGVSWKGVSWKGVSWVRDLKSPGVRARLLAE